ncbi:MAG: T9SS type A sorting domain-containing protein [Bacteroidetes bacterium]|nr:T9SS type A sorting domain-containing protein [Bacteroidota bacterium]
MHKYFWLLFLPVLAQAQINGSFSFGGQTRNYIVHLPTGYSAGQSLPLVFVLHGFTQSASAIQSVTGFDNLSDAENFIAVYPNGVGNAWNTNSGFPGGSTADDVGFIGALIDTMHTSYNVDLSRVYSCGFSAGGFLSHLLACSSTSRFAAIASVSGTMSDAAFNACSPTKPIPVLQIHGTTDGIVSYNGGIGGKGVDDIINYWKGFENCSATALFTAFPDTANDGSSVEKYEYQDCDSCSKVTLLKVISGGHQWPGTSGALGGLGNINRDIKATNEIWNFFKAFTSAGCATVSMEEKNGFSIKTFPNPVNDFLIIELEDVSNNQVFLTDLLGRVVYTDKLKPGRNVLNLTELCSGIYALRVGTGAVNNSRLLTISK